jgi:hypothetical protein
MNAITIQEQQGGASPVAMMLNQGHMSALFEFAAQMAKSAVTVPDHLKDRPADCLAIAMQAAQWGMNPFAVAQKTHLVSGRLGYEAQLVNAVVQNSGAITGAFSYEFKGEGQNLECRVGAVLKGQSAVTWGEWLRCGDVTTKNSPLWKVNPKQQMGYLQVKNWARLYCPGAILGVYSDDELVDATPAAAPAQPRHMGAVDEVKPALPAALPAYSDADLEKNLPAWLGLIDSGRKTAEQIIATVSTKATLSDEQKKRIRRENVIDAETGEVTNTPDHDDFVADMEAAEAQQ